MTPSVAINHYLVERYSDKPPVVFDFGTDGDEALMQYGHSEFLGIPCVLLGADSVETLRTTHPNWVTPDAEVRVVGA